MSIVQSATAGAAERPAWLASCIDDACARTAPTWPLDQLIAVNPWWEMRGSNMATVSARLSALAGARCLMPRDYYAALWRCGAIETAHLQAAAGESPTPCDIDALTGHLERSESLSHWHNVSDLLDSTRDRQHKMAWRDEITHQISQFCAACFQQGGPLQIALENPGDLYRHWLKVAREDHGIAILMGEAALPAQFAALPADHHTLIAEVMADLDVAESVASEYAHALLLDINGWASWVAYLRWQDRLSGRENRLMEDLLAIRLAWELVLWRHQALTDPQAFRKTRHLWNLQTARLPEMLRDHEDSQRLTWVWQRAAEIAYQRALHHQLRRAVPEQPQAHEQPRVQAVFCIDVRSEPVRRALEAQHPGIRTLGFAGFFGIPMEYQAAATDFRRPQLPGLLKPSLQLTEGGLKADQSADRRHTLNRRSQWLKFTEAPPATFSLVEATGLLYAFKMLRMSLFPPAHHHPVNQLTGRSEDRDWQLSRNGSPLTTADKAELAAGILHAMGLNAGFAATVLLVGHGSSSRNNPHAAALDCGACGGQSGELNVRVLAMLLNDGDVRESLRGHGVEIPVTTRFVAALHDTTTDQIHCLGNDGIDPQLADWLSAAGAQARRERAVRLGVPNDDGPGLLRAGRRRARDWSQVRPEWGLANNASFIVAPRERTRHIDLEGRTFLHDYRWQADGEFSVLELIMTAPLLVTNWINLQYFASVTDNHRYGSGNKVLHNVVGGNLGVFEGNGGDLRIGLPMQSVHDGSRWIHQPLRLSVYLAAPREPIAAVAERHAVVGNLIDNDWLYLFRLDDDGSSIERLYQGRWRSIASSP